jgi:hypothetical protein
VTSDGLVRPLNAPGGATTPIGIQPGAPSAIIANRVVVFGNGASGIFVYDGTPAYGNPPVDFISLSPVDPYKNLLPEVGIVSWDTAQGTMAALVNGALILDTAGDTRIGQDGADLIVFSTSASLLLALPVQAINALEPGTSGVEESWHPMTLLNGWTAGTGLPPSYRYLASPPDTVEIAGSLNGSASTSSVFAQLPGGYIPENTQEGWLAPTTLTATGQYFFQVGTDGNIAVEGGTLTYNFNFHGFLSLIAGTNVPLAISGGGTGATTAIGALQNLGAAPSLRLVYVDEYGSDPTGATPSDTAVNTAIGLLGTSPGAIVFGVGTYELANNHALHSPQQCVIGPGSPVCTINYTGTGALFDFSNQGTFNNGYTAGILSGITISGQYSGNQIGFSYANLQTMIVRDVKFYGLYGGAWYGYIVAGSGGYAEELHADEVLISECGNFSGWCIGYNGSNYTAPSFDYLFINMVVVVEANIDVIAVYNNAQIQGGEIHIRGNLHGAGSNTGAIFSVERGNAGGVGYMTNLNLDVSMECGNGAVGHYTVWMGATNGTSQFLGIGNLYAYPAGCASQGQHNAGGPVIAISGRTNAPDGTQMNAGTAFAVIGSTDWDPRFANFGTLYLGVQVYWELADTQCALLGNGANGTLVFNGTDSFVRKGTLMLKQPASGTPGTVTWPASVLWIGGVAPTLSVVSGYTDHFSFIWVPAVSKWYGQYIGTYHG